MKVSIFSDEINNFIHILDFLSKEKCGFDVDLISINDLENKNFSYKERVLTVNNINNYFEIPDLIIFSVNKELTNKYIEKFINKCIIIDESSWSLDKDPENANLILKNVNINKLKNIDKYKIISFPCSASVQLIETINPLYDIGNIKRIVVSTYQSVSDIGKSAMDELYNHTKKIYENNFLQSINFKKQIPFNVLPQIGDISDNKQYGLENRILIESKKIFENNTKFSVTCAIVPVFVGSCQSINIEFENNFKENDIYELYEDYGDYINIIDNFENFVYATPKEVAMEDTVFISRIRKDNTINYGLNIWSVADGCTLKSRSLVELVIELFKYYKN